MQVTSTRDPALRLSFREAVLTNLPPSGGLFVPAALPCWPDIADLLATPWTERNGEILHRLLGDEVERATVERWARQCFDFPVPLVRVDERTFALELFHGPSLAFKDFGARFLAALLERFAAGDRPRTILTATSGDTGAAVAAAFGRRPGFRTVVLYPLGRISELQERQLVCLDGNVTGLAVEGTFDDCQHLAKQCFADARLAAELGLTSANSINLGRLLAQVLYYFEAVAQVGAQLPAQLPAQRTTERRPGELSPGDPPVVFSVPSGNFGNLCAGLYARALGLPVAAFIAATNANRTVPDYLDSGRYEPRRGQATLSNAMDVGDPSNWERIAALHGGDWEALRAALRWGALDDTSTAAALRDLWRRGYQADPHGAVACGVLATHRRAGEIGIFLATAHPAKFAAALEPLGLDPTLPEALRDLLDRTLRREVIAVDLSALKERLRRVA